MNRPPDTRRERQRREIEVAVRAGDLGRAEVLAQEHLSEFPEDADMLTKWIRH